MPLRKTKGRRRPRAPAAGRAKGDPESEVHVNPEKDKEQSHDPVEDKETHPESADGCGMDEEERRARETIALLAKKYQVRLTEDSNNSLDVIRVDDSEAAQFREDLAEKVEKENRGQPSSPLSSRRARRVPQKLRTIQKRQKGNPEKETPVFKVPKPLVNHSTPATTGRRSLFGFEELDSPLTLSPVATTPAHSSLSAATMTQLSLEEGSKLVKPSPYSRLRGTYDIPFRKKTPRRPPGRKREKRKSVSGEDCWAEQLNAQFSEVDQFELAIE